jgi:autotransporter passenger strand-loop-strand repeat protein
LDIGTNGTLYLSGGTLSAPTTVESQARLDVTNGSIAPDATIEAGGHEYIEAGGSAAGARIDGGTFEIAAGGSVADAPITFLGTGGSLRIDGATLPTNTIDGFVHAGNKIELTGVAFDASSPQPTLLNDDTHHNVLEVQANGSTYLLQLDPGHDFSGVAFSALPNPSAAGTEITNCYVTGTRILTERGEVAVERLAAGDFVVTASGARRPVKWIGRRRLNCRRQADPTAVWPYRVLADAFAPGAPHTDLWLSPDHCIAVDAGPGARVFIAVSALANGATIAQVPCDEVTYWHLELESHDVLMANGLPAESYLDSGNRGRFDNGGGATALRPGFAAPEGEGFCLPLASEGPRVAAVRRSLLQRCETLGWRQVERAAEVRIVVEGREERWEAGLELRFRVPSVTRDIRLRATTFTPWHFADALSDRRRLGVAIRGLSIAADGDPPRVIAMDHPALREGFHGHEGEGVGAYRWTSGEARLPWELWAGLRGAPTFTVTLVETAQKLWRREGGALETARPRVA